MAITTEDHVHVRTRADELGCTLPDGLVILPDNFTTAQPGDELRFRGEATTTRKLLRKVGIKIERLSSPEAPVFIHNRSFDLAIPAIFIGSELLKQNPDVTSMIVDMVRDHVKELFGPLASSKKIKTEIVIEDRRSGRCRKINYEGDADGLKEVTKLVKSMCR